MSAKQPFPIPASVPCPAGARTELTIRVLRTPAEVLAVEREWEQCRQKSDRPALDQHARFLTAMPGHSNRHSVLAVCLWNGNRLLGAAPLTVHDPWRFGWRVPEVGLRRNLLQFNMRLAEFHGPDFMGDLDAAATGHLLNGVLESCGDCNVIRFDHLRADSKLCRLLCNGGPDQRRRRWNWRRRVDERRWLVPIIGNLGEYLSRHSSKTRWTLRKKARILTEHLGGQMRIQVVCDPPQVGSFVRSAQQVAARSWQAAPFSTARADQLHNLALQGWLRCYLLSAAERPLAYVIGRQSDGVYAFDEAAFDKDLASCSPGNILCSKLIEDLHAQENVRWLDFGPGDIAYKEFWSQEYYMESSLYLIKPGWHNAFAFWPMMAVRWPFSFARVFMGWLGREAQLARLAHRFTKNRRHNRAGKRPERSESGKPSVT